MQRAALICFNSHIKNNIDKSFKDKKKQTNKKKRIRATEAARRLGVESSCQCKRRNYGSVWES